MAPRERLSTGVLAGVTTGLWAATVALWLLDSLGRGLPAAVDRAVAALALAATAALLVRAVARRWRQGLAGRLLLAVLALALAACFIGLASELTTRYFGDEGIYLANARRINAGRLFRPTFVYPHLLFQLDALALWLAGLFGPVAPKLASLLYGVEGESAVAALVTRWVTALMGALTAGAVFAAARRVAGLFAAGTAGALAALSPVYLEVSHLNLSDVPGAFFAAMTVMQSAALLDGESRRGYLLAGLWAGLAAGGKYPAGVAAVAIAAVWLRGRLAERRWGWGLAWAAAAAAVTFVATTPSLLAFPDAVFTGGGRDILLGVRQYAGAGWTGVVRESNLAYYGWLLRWDKGLPALLLGLAGIAGLTRPERARWLWLTPFPAAYLALIWGLNVAVVRNLLPALPALAVLLGAGAAGWLRWLDRLFPEAAGRRRLRAAAAALLTAACLALPAWRSGVQLVRLARPTTRDLAAAWIVENVPPGSFFVREVYTPKLLPEHRYPALYKRFVVRLPPERLRHPYHDFVLLASGAYGRFLGAGDGETADPRALYYQEIFDDFELVHRWPMERFREGPEIRLYKVDPPEPPYAARLSPPIAEAVVSSPPMRDEATGAVLYGAPGEWALVKGYLEPGRYRVRLDAELAAGEAILRASDRDGREVDGARFGPGGAAEVRLPARRKYFFYVSLPPGSTLRGVTARRLAGPGPGSTPRARRTAGTAPPPAPPPPPGAGR